MKSLKWITFLTIILFTSTLFFSGCSKEDPDSEVVLYNNSSEIAYIGEFECGFIYPSSIINGIAINPGSAHTLKAEKGSSKNLCIEIAIVNNSFNTEDLTITFPSEGGDSKTVNLVANSGGGGSGSGNGKDCSNANDCPVAVNYSNQISAGTGCQPCANCAILACYICTGVDQATINAQIAVVQQEAVALGGNPTCPELY